jgi:hypothetical protein
MDTLVAVGTLTGYLYSTVVVVGLIPDGGLYFEAENSSELDSVFRDISMNIRSGSRIDRLPTSTNVTTESGDMVPPQVVGDTSGVANDSEGHLNVNEPGVASKFSHSFVLEDGENATFNATIYECAQWNRTGRTVGGNVEYTCTNVTATEETVDEDNVTIKRDGDDVSTLLADDDHCPGGGQEDLRDIIQSHPDVNVTGSDELEMKSNQALVYLDYPDHDPYSNRMVMLYQIGLSEEEARYDDVVNGRVENVTAGR